MSVRLAMVLIGDAKQAKTEGQNWSGCLFKHNHNTYPYCCIKTELKHWQLFIHT